MSDFDNLTIIDRLNITLSNLNMTHLIGKIKIYAGTSLPTGYVWCDGTNGTPDLTNNKFIISDQSAGTQQQIGNNSFTNNMITHNHNVTNTVSLPSVNGYNIKFGAGSFGPSALRSIYNDLNNAYITKPNTSVNTTSNNFVSKNLNNNGDYARARQHTHDLTDTTSGTPTINSNVCHNMNSYSQFQQYRNVTTNNTGNSAEYLPPYINIGFIMKA